MSNLPDYREIEIPMSLDALKDNLASLLYTLGYVFDDEEILRIEGQYLPQHFWIKVRVKRQQQVDVIEH